MVFHEKVEFIPGLSNNIKREGIVLYLRVERRTTQTVHNTYHIVT